MFLEFHDLIVRGEKEELFKRCFKRCNAAVQVSYEHEKAKAGSLWRFDERYHELGVEILYERFSYAMAMIIDRFHKDCDELYSLREAKDKTLSFAAGLNAAVDAVFEGSFPDMDFDEATLKYYQEDYFDEAYDEFWDGNERLKAQIAAVRNGFGKEEQTFLHGFSDNEIDDIKGGDLEADSKDCLHIMHICGRTQTVDVQKFLTATKREYLPMMIRLFVARPKESIFAKKPSPWWQFWKS